MDTSQWPQEIMLKPIEELVSKPPLERKARPQKDQALNCPRCNSTNTKFCYYNNYSLTQPRYFCKTCKRYWTEGGTLRNIPVGGSSRKNKRPSSSSSSSSSSKKLIIASPTQNPIKIHQAYNLNLAFSATQQDFSTISITENTNKTHLSALELLSKGFGSFMPIQVQDPNNHYNNSVYGSGFSLQDFNGLGNGYENLQQQQQGVQEIDARLLFPFGDLKQSEQNREHGGDSSGYYTGILGGGTW